MREPQTFTTGRNRTHVILSKIFLFCDDDGHCCVQPHIVQGLTSSLLSVHPNNNPLSVIKINKVYHIIELISLINHSKNVL